MGTENLENTLITGERFTFHLFPGFPVLVPENWEQEESGNMRTSGTLRTVAGTHGIPNVRT